MRLSRLMDGKTRMPASAHDGACSFDIIRRFSVIIEPKMSYWNRREAVDEEDKIK